MKHHAAKIQGIWTAIVTPFNEDFSLDMPAFERLVLRQRDAGIDGIVIAGTTGESPTLSVQEKLSLIKKARALVGSTMAIMAGSGSSNTQQSIELSKLSCDAGADSLLIVTPPYNKPSKEGHLKHFESIKKAVSVPICLYHVPSRTGQKLPVHDLAQIINELGLEAIKEASGEVNYISHLTRLTKAQILSGDDLLYFPSLIAGCHGLISVLSNFYPGEYVSAHKAWCSQNIDVVQKYHQTLLPMAEAMFIESNPGPIKFLLSLLKLCEANLRLPLCQVSAESAPKLLKILQDTEELLKVTAMQQRSSRHNFSDDTEISSNV